MDDHTLQALNGSIQKWRAIVAGTGSDEGTVNCPLCAEFYANGCRGCPVAERTSAPYCHRTPYNEFCDMFDSDDAIGLSDVAQEDRPEFLRLGQAELDFLVSLLPIDE